MYQGLWGIQGNILVGDILRERKVTVYFIKE